MKNIFKKISISIVILAILASPITTFAGDMIIKGIKGSGTWNGLTNPRSFTGTTDAPNGPLKGTWSLNYFSGNWTGTVLNGKITGTWTGLYTSLSTSGNWVGSDLKIDIISTLPATDIVTGSSVRLNGNYTPGTFSKIYFKYGNFEPFQGKTEEKTPPNAGFNPVLLIEHSEQVNGLVAGLYKFKFCGLQNGQEICGNTYDFGEDPNNLTDTGEKNNSDTVYTYLAPLGEDKSFNSRTECAFADYANKFIKIFIGICALLAMVMIISGGIQYMTSELVSSEVQGKTVILQAVFGLILAVSGYAILNTINPKLLDLCIDKNLPQANVTVLPDAGDDTIDPDFANGIKKYTTDASISPELIPAIAKLKDGWQISKINVYSSSNKMQIDLQKGTEFDNTTYINMAPGIGGYAQIGNAKQGDKKTPMGNWKILNIEYTPGVAQFNGKGSNMGAAFWLLSPMSSGERGIGIHGNKNGTLSATNGCVRLKNSDILELQPYIKTGIQVVIQ